MLANQRIILFWFTVIVFALFFVHNGERARSQAPQPGIELKVVKYNDLVAAVKAQKGKVLIVDIWAEY